MSPEIISIIGILVGLAALIVLAMKGVSLYISAPLAAAVVAIFSGKNVIGLLTGEYMTGFAGFMQSYFLMFALSSIFAKLMGDSGAAKLIALKIAGLVRKSPAKYQKLFAVLSVGIMTAILTYGGINLYCCVFVLVSIGKDLFEEFDIPWHLYMASSLGSGSFTMTMLPGTPSIQNLIPTEILGTSASAAPVIGSISAVVCIILSVFYVKYAITKTEKKGEHFLPTGSRIAGEQAEDLDEPDMNIIVSLLPSVALLVALNGLKLSAVESLLVAILAAIIIYGKQLVKNKVNLFTVGTEGIKNAIMVLLNVCVIVGFGSVVAATKGYELIMSGLDSIPGSPIIQLIIAVNLAAGVCGSASGGLSIGLNLFGQRFIDAGLSPDIVHRLAVMSSGGLDSLPHSSGTASALGVAQLTHKEGYMHVFWLNTVIPIICTILAGFLASIGIC